MLRPILRPDRIYGNAYIEARQNANMEVRQGPFLIFLFKKNSLCTWRPLRGGDGTPAGIDRA